MNEQTDLNLRCAHIPKIRFLTLRLICVMKTSQELFLYDNIGGEGLTPIYEGECELIHVTCNRNFLLSTRQNI